MLGRCNMAEILPIRRKTPFNQSTKYSVAIFRCCAIHCLHMAFRRLMSEEHVYFRVHRIPCEAILRVITLGSMVALALSSSIAIQVLTVESNGALPFTVTDYFIFGLQNAVKSGFYPFKLTVNIILLQI